ncbi:basic region leucin zipper protein [Mycena polygramma]|nr:basic region leucin zipper protein [Mycena polygramma]
MTRGRKKDTTIPPTRALALQRDYRARKTQYIADLETRCKATEEENVRLKEEVAFLRAQGSASGSTTLSPAAIQASAHLRDTLAAASASLSNFMQVALPSGHGMQETPPSYAALQSLSATATTSIHQDQMSDNHSAEGNGPPRSESPCCGGYINCEGLVEEEDDEVNSQGEAIAMISQIRSTSG